MSAEKVTDEMLMAYADGELERPESERIAALARADPAIAARLAVFMRTALAARNAFTSVQAEPVPPALIATVMGDPAGGRPARNNRTWRRAMMPLAASLVLVAGIGGYLAGLATPQAGAVGFLAAATGAPALEALARTPSGETVRVSSGGLDIEITGTGTYGVADGVCRIFEAGSAAGALRGLACTEGEGWSVPVIVSAGGEGYRLASEASSALIDLYLDEAGASGDIGADAEAELMARGWR